MTAFRTCHTQELLACPFCGGAATDAHLAGSAWFIAADHQSGCHFADFQRSEAEAIAAWNTRVPPPACSVVGGHGLDGTTVDFLSEPSPPSVGRGGVEFEGRGHGDQVHGSVELLDEDADKISSAGGGEQARQDFGGFKLSHPETVPEGRSELKPPPPAESGGGELDWQSIAEARGERLVELAARYNLYSLAIRNAVDVLANRGRFGSPDDALAALRGVLSTELPPPPTITPDSRRSEAGGEGE